MKRFIAISTAVLALAACGNDADATPSRTLRVFAASSLREAFSELAREFESEHDGVRVELNLAGSSALVQQIGSGAPADVIATADQTTIGKVKTVTSPKLIARSRLVIAVEEGNPKQITSVADLARSGVVFVACAPEVPCGRLAAEALRQASVTTPPASREENAKGVVSKVALGEADAGIVYATDARAAARHVDAVSIDDAPLAEYPIALVRKSELGEAFVEVVSGAVGRNILAKHGFLAPH